MQSIADISILRAQHCHVGAMAHVFLNSFVLNGSVKLMYTKAEIWLAVQEILHDQMDDKNIDFRLAVTRESGLVVVDVFWNHTRNGPSAAVRAQRDNHLGGSKTATCCTSSVDVLIHGWNIYRCSMYLFMVTQHRCHGAFSINSLYSPWMKRLIHGILLFFREDSIRSEIDSAK